MYSISFFINPTRPPNCPNEYAKLTGEAFSANRRALMASVSHGENSVEPQSLSCAVDVTPGEVGGGPLGSAALIEQIKRAGAAKEVRL